MPDPTVLELQLAGRASRPAAGEAFWNRHRGGPDTLLRWLETQLGLQAAGVPHATRVLEFMAALERRPGRSFAQSLLADRWETAGELLARRDQLRLAGWDGRADDALPPLVRDLARATEATPLRCPDDAARLAACLAALDRGQVLPPHRLVLADPAEAWPACWRALLARLTTERAALPRPLAEPDTSLRAVQRQVLAGDVAAAPPDPSLRWLRSRSRLAACEAVARALAADPACLSGTVICCEDPAVGICLDGCLARLGVPTAGAAVAAPSHPALQVLPLALRLCWEPVDPALLLDFLALPVGPIPPRAARRLMGALAEQPGLGSAAWAEAFRELCEPEADPDGRLAARLRDWLDVARHPWGTPLPAPLVQERCARVARWAAGRARAGTDGLPPGLPEALEAAAGQAATLGDIVATQGGPVSEPQLGRLLEASLPHGISLQPHPEAAGGPRLVTSLAEITAPCVRLVWLGLSTGDPPAPRWTAVECARLRAAGIDLDDGSRALAALRDAERRGLAGVREAVLAIALPEDQERRPHPVWLQVAAACKAAGVTQPVDLERVLAGDGEAPTPWALPRRTFAVEPPQPRRVHWALPPGLLRDRDDTSASELICRLGCPLQWVFRYAARLAPGTTASLPDDFLLRGTFSHEVLQAVADAGGVPLPPAKAEEAVLHRFDVRLPLDAAPLAQPARLADRLGLRAELAAAARTLSTALHAGGYRVAGFEAKVEGEALGRSLQGRIDCLLQAADGWEAVLDFKYAGREKYRRLLADGRAVQLATYAHARAGATGRHPAVAYLILCDALLFTPAGSALRGATPRETVSAPAIADVWRQVEAAVPAADGWLTGGEPVPARPLQAPAARVPGAALVIDEDAKKERAELEPCKYCDYQQLCGLAELG
ncbi:MAG: PD-(D/E)XK nuclease family protein [Candidatus Methylomirabilales bacterium]